MVHSPEEPCRQKTAAPRPDAEGWREERIASTPAEQRRIVTEVIAAMTALRYGERDLFGMRLALEEALVNAIKHGHQGDAAKLIRVRYQVTAERVQAEIEDQGPGFDPDHVPDPRTPERLSQPGGRGLLLMRAYLTQVCYVGRGNRVQLDLARSAP
jgi:serine/threonine-protein kinase RsbW